jgi:hypothetical protein
VNSLTLVAHEPGLARFTACEPRLRRDRLSHVLTGAAFGLALLTGGLLAGVRVPVRSAAVEGEGQPVRIRLAPPPPAPLVIEPEIKPDAAPEPPRLAPQTILAAPLDRPAVVPDASSAVAPAAGEAPQSAPARRVYGVRKVYAKGLGVGSTDGAGLVTTRGNALGGQRDTLTATAADLQGKLAPLSTVDQAPEPLYRAKPDYSPAMRKARAEGVVTAYLLVDTDGSVQAVEITADIGWDSREVAAAALRRCRFSPALRNGQPVAVWILHRIRFEFQE